jgi:metabolite-proton symporter
MVESSPRTDVPIRRIAAASLVGTTIEFFDFFIFGTAAALVFGPLFFPDLSPLAGTLSAFATFGVAFVARPLGALVFGHFGDRLGRKQMLVTTLLMMGVGTVAVGLLPTYAQVGIWAPILLVLCRLLQGLALGGEWGGAVLMAIEHAPKNKRAFYGSWPQVGVPFGLVLATGGFYAVQQMPTETFMSWGWRVPFLLSGLLVAVGLYIRLKIEDSPAFLNLKEQKKEEKFPAGVVFRKAWRSVVLGAFAIAAANIPFYMATVFALTYGAEDGIGRNTILAGVCFASLLQMMTIPFAGQLCDRFGRRPLLMVGSALTILMAFPFFWLLDTHNVVAIVVGLIIVLPICHTLTYAPMASFLPELFPTQLRYSGAGIAYTTGGLLFSAPVPFVSAALLGYFDAAWPLSVYIMLGGVLTLIAVWSARESKHDDIDWHEMPGDVGAQAPVEGRPAAPVSPTAS